MPNEYVKPFSAQSVDKVNIVENEHSSVTINCKINDFDLHATIDSGASCSVISHDVLKRINMHNSDNLLKSNVSLIDASGNSMDVDGVIKLLVLIKGFRSSTPVEFVVVNSNYSCVLLGRNFMSNYGDVTFDFVNGKVKLGGTWVKGVRITKKQTIRLINKAVIPPRSEKLVALKCHNDTHLVPCDFEPRNVGPKGVHISRARITPNLDGVFHTTFLN